VTTAKQYEDYVTYSIKRIVLTDDYLGERAQDNDDGTCSLVAEPLHMLAVVNRITRRRLANGTVSFDPKDREVESMVVGLELLEGYFSVVNESSNLAGLSRKGDDIPRATGFLRRDYRERLRQEPVAGAG
jgi:hypothetical protein